ncbi:hypothetical protein AURDEDRAFT_173377 [Auricularia subglabra TFB-10046 SS5]|uniref:Uncharacterized protein n=1 Tax=Auricularia subglabra (strain TFB-10046 / SS5) TaxID=717982 RepID=J0WVV9_AURST|nr:hypothetical protein AURDEDRAFT_173377 [Auricularia subglabra TFB-10046 SS5]
MRFSVLAFLPFASAYITGLAPYTGTYAADDNLSMFPVTFTTYYTKVPFFDLSVSLGITTPAQHTSNEIFGNLLINVDLVALKHDHTVSVISQQWRMVVG